MTDLASNGTTVLERANATLFATAQRVLRGHMPALDGVRGLAIILVMVSHLRGVLDPHTYLERVLSKTMESGWIGVDLFFVLSGFLITGILLDTKSSRGYFSSFYMRRILRIFPLYYTVSLTYLVVIPLLQHHAGLLRSVNTPGPSKQIWFWTYTVNWGQAITHQTFNSLGHFWSLAIEEQFYLLWPLLVRNTSKRQFARLCVGLALASQLLRIILVLLGFSASTIFQITVTRLDGLALGSLAALIVRDEALLSRAVSSLKYLVAIPFAGLVVLALAAGSFAQVDHGPLVILFAPLPLAVMFASVLLSTIVRVGSPFERLLRTRWLRSCGKYSYAMYVFHLPLKNVLERGSRPFFFGAFMNTVPSAGRILIVMAYVIACSVATYLIARISWWAVERHFMILKQYFGSDTRARKAGTDETRECPVSEGPSGLCISPTANS
jgi:peptidoglycan/LPS O-acetylase OafA/YrhL